MSKSDIHLICFDIGGVLVKICRSWVEGCTAAGLPLRKGVRILLEQKKATRGQLVRLYQTGQITTDEYCDRVSQAIENTYSPQEIRDIHDAWLLDEYEGLLDVIDAIHDAGYETACLSNINAEHWNRMKSYPAVMRLKHRFGSHLIGHHKPDASIYLHLEEQLALEGHQILFYDDLLENIEAARTRGWNAVQIDHTQPTAQQIMDSLLKHDVLKNG